MSNPSVAITVCHLTASFVLPDSDPGDGFFYVFLTPMIDPYNPSLAITVCHLLASLVMPDSDSRDGVFYPLLTPMIDPYMLTLDLV